MSGTINIFDRAGWLGEHTEMLMSVKASMSLCLPVLFCWPSALALGWSRE